jgi:hypothetical protein
VFYGWLALFVAQARLVAAGRTARHRELGVLGVSVATAMCFVGVAAAVGSMRQTAAAGFTEQALGFSVVPLTGIAFFAVLFALAVINVRRPDVHKRLMLVATVSLLNAAVGRLFVLAVGGPPPAAGVEPPPVLFTVPAGLLADLLLVPALVHDWKTRGRVHPTYWVAGAALVASQLLRGRWRRHPRGTRWRGGCRRPFPDRSCRDAAGPHLRAVVCWRCSGSRDCAPRLVILTTTSPPSSRWRLSAGGRALCHFGAADLLGEYPAVQYVPPAGTFHLDLLTRLGQAFAYGDLEIVRTPFEDLTVSVVIHARYRMKRDTVRLKDRRMLNC